MLLNMLFIVSTDANEDQFDWCVKFSILKLSVWLFYYISLSIEYGTMTFESLKFLKKSSIIEHIDMTWTDNNNKSMYSKCIYNNQCLQLEKESVKTQSFSLIEDVMFFKSWIFRPSRKNWSFTLTIDVMCKILVSTSF